MSRERQGERKRDREIERDRDIERDSERNRINVRESSLKLKPGCLNCQNYFHKFAAFKFLT